MYGFVWNYVETWWFWICVVLFVAIAAYNAIDWTEAIEDIVLMLGGLLVAVVVFFIGCMFWSLVLPHHDIHTRQELKILNDTTLRSGRVVLGSGYLGEKPAFSFYSDAGNFSRYQVVKTNQNTRIYEDLKPGERPWLVTLDDCALWGKVATCFIDDRKVVEAHVPPGTIKPSLQLDARA